MSLSFLRRLTLAPTGASPPGGGDDTVAEPAAPPPLPASEAGTLFHRCPVVFGEINDLPDQPRLTRHDGALLHGWGLYDTRRQLISDSAFFRGVPVMAAHGAPPAIDRVPARTTERLPLGRYFWIGPIHPHFGHFLISSLSRLWALERLDVSEFTFLYLGGTPGELFTKDYVRDTFGALGISAAQLHPVSGPLFIPDVTVAEPSLVENFGISHAFVATLQRIRERLLPGIALGGRSSAVYVSKEQVTHGVRGFAGEAEVTAILRREGMEVASPERLPFRDQLAFWCEHEAAIGFAGSAFHLAAVAGGRRLCTVSHDHVASCNQVLLDRAAGNSNLYLHAGPHLVSRGANGSFTDLVSIVDPPGYARAVLDIAGRMANLPGQRMGAEPRSAWPVVVGMEPFGANLAIGGTATQSSVYEHDEGATRTADGAISGRLAGTYQFSTRHEPNPWWQLELPVLARIYEVRIFNRAENAVVRDRLERFVLSLSSDAADWLVVHAHTGPAPGADGQPFRWQAGPTALARFVRIALPGEQWLHLDQVEVFGEPV